MLRHCFHTLDAWRGRWIIHVQGDRPGHEGVEGALGEAAAVDLSFGPETFSKENLDRLPQVPEKSFVFFD